MFLVGLFYILIIFSVISIEDSILFLCFSIMNSKCELIFLKNENITKKLSNKL